MPMERTRTPASTVYLPRDSAELLDSIAEGSGVGTKAAVVERLLKSYASMPEAAQAWMVGTLRPSMRPEAVKQLYEWFMRQMAAAPALPAVSQDTSPADLGREIQSALTSHPSPELGRQGHKGNPPQRKAKTAG